MLAEVTTPVGHAGPMPLVLFLHGRHSTCYRGGPDGEASGDWPCFPGWRPVPSHTGYRYIADVLASQGYLVVSISANGINGQDGMFEDGGSSARSELVRHHLAQWAEWSAHGGDPWGGRFQGRVDLDEVVLVGHSRGGEGVERATIDSYPEDPWQVQGLVLIGPTAFGRQVAPGVHTTVILPFCDGDVSDLQGQQYVDVGRDLTRDRALRSSVMAMGTNHNYYNTEWTPGLSKSPAWDDWFSARDPQCGENRSRRLTPAEQQAVGLAYTAALVDLAVADDTRSLPLLDGTRVKPRSIGRASAFVHAIGGNKRVLYAAGRGTAVRTTALERAANAAAITWPGPFDVRTGCTPRALLRADPALVAHGFRGDGARATRTPGGMDASRRQRPHSGGAGVGPWRCARLPHRRRAGRCARRHRRPRARCDRPMDDPRLAPDDAALVSRAGAARESRGAAASRAAARPRREPHHRDRAHSAHADAAASGCSTSRRRRARSRLSEPVQLPKSASAGSSCRRAAAARRRSTCR